MDTLPRDLVGHLAETLLSPKDRAALRGASTFLRSFVSPLTKEQRHYANFWRVLNRMMAFIVADVEDPATWAEMYEFSKLYTSTRDVFFMKSTRAYKKPRGGASSALRDLQRSFDIYAAPRTHYLHDRQFRLRVRMKLVRLFGAAIVIEINDANANVFMTYSERVGGWSVEVYGTDEAALDACLRTLENTALFVPGRRVMHTRVGSFRFGHLLHRSEPWFGGHLRHYRVFGLPHPEFDAAKPRMEAKWRAFFDAQ